MYAEEDYLMLSGLQHFIFCRRQWALIHIEQQWAENERTVDGQLFHAVAHDRERVEKRGDLLIMRGLAIRSAALGLSGACDVVEFHRATDGISLASYEGRWQPVPVEYKRGSPKEHNADQIQLCAQAICLEEMLLCTVPSGSLFYGEKRRRMQVTFTEELRSRVRQAAREMHEMWDRGYTPRVRPQKGCSACSLKEICLPRLGKTRTVASYIANQLGD